MFEKPPTSATGKLIPIGKSNERLSKVAKVKPPLYPPKGGIVKSHLRQQRRSLKSKVKKTRKMSVSTVNSQQQC